MCILNFVRATLTIRNANLYNLLDARNLGNLFTQKYVHLDVFFSYMKFVANIAVESFFYLLSCQVLRNSWVKLSVK